MSPNVGNFVHDLVEMAKAMETLPHVQAQLDHANDMIENYAKQVQDREIAIVNYKEQIEELNAKVRSLEVERDDASFRVLEAEDTANSALTLVRTASVDLAIAIQKLDPPKPEPVKEPEPVALTQDQRIPDPTSSTTETHGQNETGSTNASLPDIVHSVEEVPQGQSESSPTEDNTAKSMTATATADQSGVNTTSESVAPGPALGPYFGKRYHDIPNYISYHDWMEGGGTDKDYFGRASD